MLSGLRVDYLSPTLFFSDFFLLPLGLFLWRPFTAQVTRKRIMIVGSFVMYLLLVAFFSQSPFNSLYGLMRWLGYGVFAYATWYFWQERATIKHSLLVMMVAINIVSLLTLWQFFLQHSLGGVFYWIGERSFSGQTPGIANSSLNGTLVLRPYASFPHPNVLAGFLLTVLILLWGYKDLLDKTWQRYVLAGTLFLGTLAIGLTLSRTAIFIFLSVSLLWIVFARRNTKLVFWKVVLGIGAPILLLLPLLPRFSTLLQNDEAITLRLSLLRASWEIFLSAPLVGVGIKNFLPALAHGTTVALPFPLVQPAHNIFVLVIVEIGIVGLLWVVPFFKSLAFRVRHSAGEKRWVKLSLALSLCGVGVVDHYFYTLHQGQLLLMLILGILWYTKPSSLPRGFDNQKKQNTRKNR